MTVEELNAITAQFGELFKQYLTNPVFRQNIDLLMKVPIQQKDMQNVFITLDLVAQKYQYELRNSEEPWKPNILDKDASLDLISTPPLHRSFCRFGDGECDIMMGNSIPFQEYNSELADKLRAILSDEENNCCVGIPKHFWYRENFDFSKMDNNLRHWHTFVAPKYRQQLDTLLNRNKTYIDTCVTLTYIGSASTEYCEAFFAKWQNLFKGKQMVIFSGNGVFKEIRYNIFTEVADVEFVTYPSISAYKAFDDIIAKASSYPKDCILGFILGPTATVAAYEMSKRGYLAYDLGHLSKDYDAFMKRLSKNSERMKNFWLPD